MPPKVKYQREEIVAAGVAIVREKGIEALTARALAESLHVSTRPIFTYFDSMDALKRAVYLAAKDLYRSYIELGLAGKIPFLGVGQQYIRFAREERELYKLIFLQKPDAVSGGAIEMLHFSQDLVRESIMRIYHMDDDTSDKYFRDLWLAVYAMATLIVTDDCPYTDAQLSAILTELSLAVCKAYKEIPGLPNGDFDRDAIFTELVKK